MFFRKRRERKEAQRKAEKERLQKLKQEEEERERKKWERQMLLSKLLRLSDSVRLQDVLKCVNLENLSLPDEIEMTFKENNFQTIVFRLLIYKIIQLEENLSSALIVLEELQKALERYRIDSAGAILFMQHQQMIK